MAFRIPPPLWQTDPIEFLVNEQFPPSLSVNGNKTDPEREKCEDGVGFVESDAIKSFRAQLLDLPPEKLAERVEEGKDRERKRIAEFREAEEKARFFNQAYAMADFSHWSQMSYWTPDEFVSLSLGREPRVVSWEKLSQIPTSSPFVRTYRDRKSIVDRAVSMGQLWKHTYPNLAIAWAKRMNVDVPDALEKKIEDLGVQIADWKMYYDQKAAEADLLREDLTSERNKLSQHIETNTEIMERFSKQANSTINTYKTENQRLLDEIDRLQGILANVKERSLVKKADQLGTRERDSLLKMVIGMAIKKYNFKPSVGRNAATANIAKALAELEIPLDEDTIRKYLNEAKELLPSNPVD